MFARDGGRCRWCGATVHLLANCARGGCDRCAHADHVIGLHRGQQLGIPMAELNAEVNMVTACRRCNLRRSVVQRRVARRASGGAVFLTSANGHARLSALFPPGLMTGAGTR